MRKQRTVRGRTRYVDTSSAGAIPSSSTPLGSQPWAEKKVPGGACHTPGAVNDDESATTVNAPILSGPRGKPKVMGEALAMLLERTAQRVQAGTRSLGTLEMQRQHARYLLERIPAETPLAEVTPARIARALADEARGRRRPLSGGTLRKRASTLAQALELARGRRPILPEIPYRYVPRREHLPDYASYRRMRNALSPARRLYFVAATWTGQRRIDVEAMVREDLDPDRRIVLIRSTKTRRLPRWFYAAPELVRELAAHHRALAPGAKLVPAWPHVSSDLTRLSRRLGLPRTTVHRLRHTFFTWFVRANGFTPELLELGGWRDLSVPARVYAHAAPPRLRAQIARVDRIVVGARRGPQKMSRASETRKPIPSGGVPERNGGVGVGSAHPPGNPAPVSSVDGRRDGPRRSIGR